jgi:hypothetical protein
LTAKRQPTRRVCLEALPLDAYWPIRVHVANDGDCVPYELMLAWHAQFLTPLTVSEQ